MLSILNLIKLSIIEGQYIQGFYKHIEILINTIVNKNHWIVEYCEWLFTLLKLIGYQIDYQINNDIMFFNLFNQKFEKKFTNSCIEFPHSLFSRDKIINFNNLNAVFVIFESIFLKNHLENDNYKMLTSYINFKNIILKRLKS